MIAAALAFAAGVMGLHLLPVLPPSWLGPALLAALVLPAWRWAAARLALLAVLGGCWAYLHLCVTLCQPFPETLARAPLVVEGRISSIPVRSGQALRFQLQIERAELNGARVPYTGLVRLSCYRECPEVHAGERWRLPVRLKPRHGYANPGGFDYERWLLEQGVQATGSFRGKGGWVRLDAGPGRYWLARWREALAAHLARVLGESPAVGLVQALTIGERSAIPRDTWEVFTRTGTNHLVAISGLHVGLVAAAVHFLARRLWARSGKAMRLMAAPRAASLAAGLAALAYAGLAGFAVSTERALIMLAVVLGALFWRRTLRPYHALSLALAGVLIWDPQAVLSFGFWLSFGAVGLLLLSLGQRLPRRDLWTRWGHAQWAVSLGLSPLLLLFFAQTSVIAPLANLIAVPLFSLLLLPLVLVSALISLVPGMEWSLRLTARLLDLSVQGLGWLSEPSWAAVQMGQRPLWVWLLSFLGAVLMLAPRGLPGRWLGLVLLIPLYGVRPAQPPPGEVWISLLDVGQGLALVAETAAGALVYDTGPAFPGGFEVGSQVLVPFLRARGIRRLERLVISHADRDHSGGAAALVAAVPVDRLQSGEPGELALPGVELCRAGEFWEWAGVSFRYLHPEGAEEAGNNASCVLRIATAGSALLVTGDVDRKTERGLVERLGRAMRSEVLIAGHHGSATSTSAELLTAVSPAWVLFSSGYANAFGFPAADVVARVQAVGARWLNTASSGAIQLRMGPQGLIQPPSGWRRRSGRLWTHRSAADAPSDQNGADEDQ